MIKQNKQTNKQKKGGKTIKKTCMSDKTDFQTETNK